MPAIFFCLGIEFVNEFVHMDVHIDRSWTEY